MMNFQSLCRFTVFDTKDNVENTTTNQQNKKPVPTCWQPDTMGKAHLHYERYLALEGKRQ